MLFILKYFVSLECQQAFGEIQKHLFFINRATLRCYVSKGTLNSLQKLVDTPKGWLAVFKYSIMSTSKQIKKETERLLRTLSVREINSELRAMVTIYISEMKLGPKEASQTAFVGLSLVEHFRNVGEILRKEDSDE